MKRHRSEAQREAERRYRATRAQVLIRFTADEIASIDSVSEHDRAAWIKAQALAKAAYKPKAKRAR